MKIINNQDEFYEENEKSQKPLILFAKQTRNKFLITLIKTVKMMNVEIYGICFMNQSRYEETYFENIKILNYHEIKELKGAFNCFIGEEIFMTGFNNCYADAYRVFRYFNRISPKKVQYRIDNLLIALLYLKLRKIKNKSGQMKIWKEIACSGTVFHINDIDVNSLARYARESRLKSNDITFISNNCLGTHFYRWLNIPPNSPTININIEPFQYIKFCKELKYYLGLELKFSRSEMFYDTGEIYPVGDLGDIEIHFVHYDSWEKAKKRWDKYIKRVNWRNIYYLLDDYQLPVSKNQVDDFLVDNSNNKLVLSQKYMGHTSIIFRTDKDNIYEKQELFESKLDLVRWLNERIE